MSKTNVRQPSFVVIEEDENSASPFGVRSRLPAMSVNLDSDMNRSLIDLTPSGEVQMRVNREKHDEFTSPRAQAGATENSIQTSTESIDVPKLKQELNEIRERESMRRQQADLRGLSSDQCYGPSTNSLWQAPHNINDEGCSTVRVDRNGCVDTMTPPVRRATNAVAGNGNYSENSHPIFNINDNTVNNCVPQINEPSVHFKNKKTITFDGTGSWQDFLVQFELISTVNKWDNGMKAYELATSLRGVAQGIVTDIEPAKRLNYDYLVSALTSRFEPANQVNMYKVQMNSIYRKPSQTLPEMAQEIRRVTRQAYPTAPNEIRDQLAKDCFVRAINDPKIQLSIFQREPKTIDDCVRFGLEYEAFTVDQKRLNNAKPATRMLSENDDSAEYDVVTRLAKISEQMEKLTNKEGQNFSRMTCFYCGNKGHIKKECRKFEWDKRHNCVKRKLVNAGDKDRSPAVEERDSRSISLIKSNKQDSLFVKCFIVDVVVNCLIDTGSTICVIHPRKFEKLPIEFKPEIQRNNQRLCLADGSFVNTMGHVDLPIKIGNYTIIQKFTVAEIDVPAVIGYDFLHKNNCTIDMGKGVLLLKDSKIDCIKESQMSSTFKIKLSDKLTIPPNTEVIISGIVEGDSSSIMNAIVEPIPSKHTDTLLVAKALVDPSCGQVPIRMVNLSKYEQIMQPFTHVATCELIDTGSVFNEPRSEKLRRLSSSSCDEVNELPSLLQDLKLRSSELLNEGQIDQLESLLKRHIQTFSKNKDDLGRATAIKHKIDTGNAKPVKQPPRRLPLTKRDEVDKEIQRLLDGKIIEPSKSPWASCIVPVTKKDGSTRICIDFRPINSLTIKDSYPLCRIDDSLDALRGSKWLSVLDLSSGYWQVEMDENDKEKTAFTSTKGLFHFNVMPMGLCNGVATFQRLMEYTLAGLNWQTCLIYIDDIIVFSDSFESHLSRLSDVLDRIALQGLKVSPKKCSLFQKQVSFLGHIVSSEGIATDPDKIACVKTWPLPKSMTDVRSFLGTCSYYRKFIKSFAEIARPLHKLTEKNCTFDWTNECNEAFEKLK
ncbi:unnamed protein product [Mytilus edulis]|uniref:Uncharacterized protein n=2 Tax=Mytilus edulis TaxID=6550 RepID=A0A8S3V4G6_MYTED|nr:unnamed protein product [Mytilus edulis]